MLETLFEKKSDAERVHVLSLEDETCNSNQRPHWEPNPATKRHCCCTACVLRNDLDLVFFFSCIAFRQRNSLLTVFVPPGIYGHVLHRPRLFVCNSPRDEWTRIVRRDRAIQCRLCQCFLRPHAHCTQQATRGAKQHSTQRMLCAHCMQHAMQIHDTVMSQLWNSQASPPFCCLSH